MRPGAHLRKFFYDDLVCKRKDSQKVLVAVQLGAWTKREIVLWQESRA